MRAVLIGVIATLAVLAAPTYAGPAPAKANPAVAAKANAAKPIQNNTPKPPPAQPCASTTGTITKSNKPNVRPVKNGGKRRAGMIRVNSPCGTAG